MIQGTDTTHAETEHFAYGASFTGRSVNRDDDPKSRVGGDNLGSFP